MLDKFVALTQGTGVKARALRGTAFTGMSFALSNMLRLAANLVLTRLLFPEAFGLMALVQVFMSGLAMFSDIGIRASIIQNPRGDDERFLNTAWTLQILRGLALWLAACALALPVAALYDEPMLAELLPVAGLVALINGFGTTKTATADRHLTIGRLTALDLLGQVVGILATILLAWLLQSVWALVFGNLIGAAIGILLMHTLLPGISNRLCFDREAVRDILGFGSFIFLSTVVSFVINQSDRAILGAFISMGALGIYNIGYFLGTVPFVLAKMIANRVVFPLYRMRHPLDAEDYRRKIFRMRRLSILGALAAAAALAFAGPWLVGVLYDPRYADAGAIVTLIAFASVPMIVVEGNTRAALAKGDSRSYFWVQLWMAVAQVACLYLGARYYGVAGAVLALGIAPVVTYPIRVRILIRYRSWDAPGEIGLMVLGLLVTGYACWLHRDAILALLP